MPHQFMYPKVVPVARPNAGVSVPAVANPRPAVPVPPR